MISLTEIAARNFKRIREDEELPEDVPLRVAVKGGGCAGYISCIRSLGLHLRAGRQRNYGRSAGTLRGIPGVSGCGGKQCL